MQRPERLCRRLAGVGAWAFLCLALVGGATQASTRPAAEAQPFEKPAMASRPMPQGLDSMPCARCYVASAPVAQGVSGEPGEPDEPAWRVRAAAVPDSSWLLKPEGWPPRLPVRIAFCRWLD